MLQKMREHTQGWWAIALAIILGLAFALFGIQYYLEGGSDQQAVAKVNGVSITEQAYNTLYQRLRNDYLISTKQTFLSDEKQAELKQFALSQLIERSLLAESAFDNAFTISGNQLSAVVQSLPIFQVNGQFSPSLFQNVIINNYPSEQAFFNELRQNIAVIQEQTAILSTGIALPDEINRAWELEMQTRDTAFLIIPHERFQNVQISAEQIQQYYQANAAAFMTPETLSIDYIQLTANDLKKSLDVSEQEIQQYYQDNSASFMTPVRFKIATIVLNVPEGASASELENIKKKVARVQSQLAKGDNFSKLAQIYSQAAIKTDDANKLQWQTKDDLDAVVFEVANRLDAGQSSAAFQTAKGYEVIKVVAKEPAQQKTLAQVHDEIKQRLIAQKKQTAFADASEKLTNLTYTNADSLQPAASALGVKVQTSEPFTKQGTKTGITANPKVITTAFSDNVLKQKNNSDAIQLDENTLLVLRVHQYMPAHEKPLNQVQPQIEAILKTQAQQKQAQTLGQNMITAMKNGANPAADAASNQLSWQQAPQLTRQTTKIDPAIILAAFNLALPHKIPQITGVNLKNGDYAVVMVSRVTPGDIKKLTPAQMNILQQQIANNDGQLFYEVYKADLLARAKIKNYLK